MMKILVTGGAGFIGCNAAARHLRRGHEVVVIDNMSRAGNESNLAWLRGLGKLQFHKLDIRDSAGLDRVFQEHADAAQVLHLAGQVAVTTSVTDPRTDFEINALGSFNVLEAARRAKIRAPILYSSTNKVYGGMEEIRIVQQGKRYAYADFPNGIPDAQSLDFHSPYGCSKGSADQYFRDYHRIYGLNTVVLRQSCIYGYRQFGMEDQGWVAWFMIAAQKQKPITIFGDGMQVRDLLFIEDLIDAYDTAAEKIDKAAGQVYNIGGGPSNVLSLLELVDYIGKRQGKPLKFLTADWRPGDQRVYISSIAKAERELGWRPKFDVNQGLDSLYNWIEANLDLFRNV